MQIAQSSLGSIPFVFETGDTIRQSPRKIDFSALDHAKVFERGAQNGSRGGKRRKPTKSPLQKER
jgi:hypothetical protein